MFKHLRKSEQCAKSAYTEPKYQYSKNAEGKVVCQTCQKSFTELTNFYRHHKTQHTLPKTKKSKEKKTYMCEICSKDHKKKSHLIKHLQTHDKPQLLCQHCQRTYMRKDHLAKHEEICNGRDQNSNNEDIDCSNDFTLPTMALELGEEEEGNRIDKDYMQAEEHEVDFSKEVGSRQTVWRKRKSLETVLQTIQRLQVNDQAKVLRKSCNESNISVMETVLMSDVESQYEAKLTNGLIEHLKNNYQNLKKATTRNEFCSLVWSICGDSIFEDNFRSWFCKKTDRRPCRIEELMKTWLSETAEPLEHRGRRGLSLDTKQLIFDMWHKYSVVTVDRRSGRDQVNMKKSEYEKRFRGLHIPDDIPALESFTSARKTEMIRATRRIATETVKRMQHLVNQKLGATISTGSIFNLRPFYVQVPSEREKESCLCKFCLNLRLKYNALNKHVKDKNTVTESLSEYFAEGILCPKGVNGFYELACIKSECGGNCNTNTLYQLQDFNAVSHNIKYHQFESEEYPYFSKKTKEKKIGTRVVRKPHESSLQDLKKELDRYRELYLHHRWEIKNDQYVWPKIYERGDLGYIYHMDYSENIACTPKYEPQDAHFSGKQISLHCTVVRKPDQDIMYAYHLSDDRTHDASFTECVLEDLLTVSPGWENYPVIRNKSDNCTSQYCCLNCFARYLKLARASKKVVLLYYGVNGHGRGLVDAMSGFGCKSCVRRKIVTEDFYFLDAEELTEFLQREFADDREKYYKTLAVEEIMKAREYTETLPIAGCRKSRMIAFHPDGTYQIKKALCSCNSCLVGKFNTCTEESISPEIEGEELLEDLDEQLPEDAEPQSFTFTEENTIAAIYSASSSFELFYLIRINKKCVAEESKSDVFGHIVQGGDRYFEGFYLEKDKETQKKVKIIFFVVY